MNTHEAPAPYTSIERLFAEQDGIDFDAIPEPLWAPEPEPGWSIDWMQLAGGLTTLAILLASATVAVGLMALVVDWLFL